MFLEIHLGLALNLTALIAVAAGLRDHVLVALRDVLVFVRLTIRAAKTLQHLI